MAIRRGGNIIVFLTLLAIGLSFATGCRRDNNQDRKSRLGRNDLEEVNRYLIQKDRERIVNYNERKNLRMTETATGLWYCIIRNKDGEKLTDNDRISINYECSLLDGTVCYSSTVNGRKDLVLGRSVTEPGLNEGLRLLGRGDSAIFILPAYLAYGLVGDGKMIPPRSVLVYNIGILPGK